MNINNQVQQMDEMVSKGAIVEAVQLFFADNASTSDYNQVKTQGKDQMIKKMEGFVGAIQKVNSIKHHYTIVGDQMSASEFTFDFDMNDGSNIHWHEIIRRVWNEEGKVTSEVYFQA